ncbi:hypothetical protein FANTH_5258 [Fusarium anthophilum]|uniref:HotDog ACOT-type domain-containing protein n=1 Tax=Fusarium anthophilum TaxID=48485 RepID=A0A8H4ZN69_9HYPO|nr:hypothetical protein FANTH_5258 [Fusarium anthophilum]
MMSRSREARSIVASLRRPHVLRPIGPALARPNANSFHTTTPRKTDGVFQGLEDKRQPMPWIEAFERQQKGLPAHKSDDYPKERDLTPKKMSDSYHRVVLPLKKDPWLLGTLFMDLDALSGIIVYKHTGPGVTTVTAALDRITIAHPLTEICDLEYSGQVTYASGRSSVEITCKVAKAREEGEPSKPEDVLLTCTFTMVALDPNTRKPVNIPKLVPSNAEEEKIFKAGEAKSLSKKETSKASLLQTEPNDAESALIHQIWLRQLAYHDPNNELRQPSNVVAMSKTQLSTAAIMQPQYRNRHQTMIFGGFHLKQTFELAFCCAASFAHARPTFISADPCTFRNPVPVGSVLYLTATVAYTDPPLLEEDGTEPGFPDPEKPMTRVHVRVDSKVRDVEHGVAKPTGQFNYTFSVPKNLKVLPHTYEEYMVYIDARRRVSLGDSQRKEESKAFSEKRPEATDNYLKTITIPQLDTSDSAKAIASLRWYMKSLHKLPDPESGVVERDIYYTARDGVKLRAHVYEPISNSSPTPPLVVYIHGGGWTIGSPEDAQRSCRDIVEKLGVVCVAPSYRQGPEDPFPASINDVWDGLKWIAANAESELKVSLSKGFVIGGSSAGGNMAAIASHLARDEKLTPPITGVFLLAPMILPPEKEDALPQKYKDLYLSRTQTECKDDPILTPALDKIFHDSAAGDISSPLFVPFIWPTGHHNLPRTYLQVCGMDVLRDEALIYEQVLREDNGIETRLDIYAGMPHIFWGAFAHLSQGKKAAVELVEGIKWLLK